MSAIKLKQQQSEESDQKYELFKCHESIYVCGIYISIEMPPADDLASPGNIFQTGDARSLHREAPWLNPQMLDACSFALLTFADGSIHLKE